MISTEQQVIKCPKMTSVHVNPFKHYLRLDLLYALLVHTSFKVSHQLHSDELYCFSILYIFDTFFLHANIFSICSMMFNSFFKNCYTVWTEWLYILSGDTVIVLWFMLSGNTVPSINCYFYFIPLPNLFLLILCIK